MLRSDRVLVEMHRQAFGAAPQQIDVVQPMSQRYVCSFGPETVAHEHARAPDGELADAEGVHH
jgi:hypothetical protein